jgi:hypothetical protein
VAARTGLAVLGVGVLLMTAFGGVPALVGLGLWWGGVLLIADSLVGGGLAAQFVWGIGVAVAVAVYLYTELPRVAVEGPGRLVVAILTVLVAAVTVARLRTRSQ